jgi:maltooligosyltrehalose trehalohydrolase
VDADEFIQDEQRRFGATATEGGVRWRVWAPKAERVELVLGDEGQQVGMEEKEEGIFSVKVERVGEGVRYGYSLDGGAVRADPYSLWQPEGSAGPSAVVFPERFVWTDGAWKGVRRELLVFYELHVGTFTNEGNFEAVIPRLASLRELGVTAIELMPVGQFSGARNWGYDGVLPFAAQNSYGGPRGLQKLVDAAHEAGLAIFLDVVYNHFGPEDNHLEEFGPYLTDRYQTPWGKAVNFDGAGSDRVREFVLDNARMWLREFHFDGLRLDAVHAFYDLGARHILQEISGVAEAVGEEQGRETHVVAESDLNDPRVLRAADAGGHGMNAQWSDDFHHAVHACLTGETRGYYRDYGERRQVARVMVEPFLYAGEFSKHRGRRHGAKAVGISGDHFVVCVQNHDQVGNRARGERLGVLLNDPAKARLAACLLLFAPHLPLLFMGEEYGEERPFPFFCSFRGEALIQAVREGRKREFAEFVGEGEVPVPDAEGTFEAARLSWSWPEGSRVAGMRRLYGDLLRARREWAGLHDFEHRTSRLWPDTEQGPVLELARGVGPVAVRAFFNLSGDVQELPGHEGMVWFSSELARYGGERGSLREVKNLRGFECVTFRQGDVGSS